MELPFAGGAYEGRSMELNAQQSINLFPVVDNNEAKNIIAMYGTPGTSVFSSTGTTAQVRAMHTMGEFMYAVVGAVVYKISTVGTATSLGSLTTSTGFVSMADNGTQILIVDGTAFGHIISSGTLTDISDPDFVSSTSCVFFDGYFIVTKTSTGRIYVSETYDGMTWASLDFATAESSPDNLVRIMATKPNLWLLGTTSTEVYYNSGNLDFPFARVPGAVVAIGCVAIASAAVVEDNVYWLSDKKTVVRNIGYNYETVSTPGIDYQLSTYTTVSDAIGFGYTLEGRSFYAITFPTQNKTWVYDHIAKYWHEWQSLSALGVAGRFRGVASLLYNGSMLIGDGATGVIYTLSMNTYTDAGLNIRRIRRTQIINKETVNLLHSMVEIEFENGVGLNVSAVTDGYDPQAVLKWSDNGGRTWSAGVSVTLGKYQVYTDRQIWRRLGKSRNRIYELTVESPVKVVILGGYGRLLACSS
jgi:hypothetical protein